jgi:hypothetical protein
MAFFFSAGHGFEIRGQNYLLPTDVPAASEGEEELVRDASFPADRIIERLQARGARTAILVLDACCNNPFERRGARAIAGAGGLAPMTPSRASSSCSQPAQSRSRTRACRATIQIRTPGSRAALHRCCQSPASAWCRSPNAYRRRSSRQRRASATSRRQPITTRSSAKSCSLRGQAPGRPGGRHMTALQGPWWKLPHDSPVHRQVRQEAAAMRWSAPASMPRRWECAS